MSKLNDLELNNIAGGVEITHESRNPDLTEEELEMRRIQAIVDRRDESYKRCLDLLSDVSDTMKKNIENL